MASELSMQTVPGKGGRGDGVARNTRWVQIGDMAILFSYQTPVAFERGAVKARREFISHATSCHLSSANAGDWPIKDGVEFEQELESQLFAELNGWPDSCDFLSSQGIGSRVIFDLIKWLREIDSVDWRRPTKLREVVGMLATEAFRQLTVARHGTSEFDNELRQKLTALIAEEKRHQEQVAAKAKPASACRAPGSEDTEA